jgi:hypothetical protein
MDCEEIAQGCLHQAAWAAKLGSTMYEALLQRMAEDVRLGGPSLIPSRTPRMSMILCGIIIGLVLAIVFHYWWLTR